jgi:hypothetical protein
MKLCIINNLLKNGIRNYYGYFQSVRTRFKRNVEGAPMELFMLNYRYKNENCNIRVLLTIKLAFTP